MKGILLLLLLGIHTGLFSQSPAGITSSRDTSFTLRSEFEKLRKTYPHITPAVVDPNKNVSEKKGLVYCARGNRKLLLDAFLPSRASAGTRTAILLIHGGGWRSGHRSMHYPLARRLAQNGYVVFTPEYRLSTEALYPAAVQDLEAAVGWVQTNAARYGIDTSRLVIAGFSAGGQLASLLGTTAENKNFESSDCSLQSTGRLAAIINLDGILSFVHPESGEGDDSKKISAATHWFGYRKIENEALWKEASPLTHVGPYTPPTLFINSSVARMHAGRNDFIGELNRYNIYTEVKTFEGAPHAFVLFQPWFDSTVQLMDDFLKKVFHQKTRTGVSNVWVSDNGDGTYKNPVLHADYSDPDVIRVGDDYYMTSSSFEDVPGLPVLHSKDLVNWKIIGHALKRQVPLAYFSVPRHGAGVWAPSIRFHKGMFYIYYPDPDFGIYLVTAKNAAGPWSDPVLVVGGKGLIDPCPLWDDDGNVYMVHAYAGSRAGIKSILAVKRLNRQGTAAVDDGVLVYDGHQLDPTVEGPKFYKRNGYYYIFAPAGGVSTGWQLVLRSKNVYGPYERKVVMDQGATAINGPHQGAWVTTQTGEDWFLHFQDKEAYGRIVHLQPMKWVKDWPVIGIDEDGDGKGEPVLTHKKPNVGKRHEIQTPAESDAFNSNSLGLQWQWMGNPKATWAFPNPGKGVLTLFSDKLPDSARNLWDAPNLLLQKFPAEEFTVTTKLRFLPNARLENEKAGLAIMGLSYATLAIKSSKDALHIVYSVCKEAGKGAGASEKVLTKAPGDLVYFRVKVSKGGTCRFSYSFDGINFTDAGEEFTATPGRWKGAKVGLYCIRESQTNDSGYVEVDWFKIEK